MDYLTCRAMEIARLLPEQITDLQMQEKIVNRCLVPHEIQDLFGLDTLKSHWMIPQNNDDAQARHNHRIRQELNAGYKAKGWDPVNFNVSALDIEKVHEFDAKIRDIPVNYDYQGSDAKKISDKYKK